MKARMFLSKTLAIGLTAVLLFGFQPVRTASSASSLASFRVTASPTATQTNTSVTVLVEALDGSGTPITDGSLDGVQVRLDVPTATGETTYSGSLTNGAATIPFVTTNYVGDVTLRARDLTNSYSGTTQVSVSSKEGLPMVRPVVFGTNASADGVQTTEVSFMVHDASGLAAADGTLVTATLTGTPIGTLLSSTAYTVGGLATFTYRSGLVAGTDHMTASYGGVTSAPAAIQLVPATYALTVLADPHYLDTSSSSASTNVVVHVSLNGANAIDGTAVQFALAGPPTGILSATSAQTVNGYATITYTVAKGAAGTDVVTVQAGGVTESAFIHSGTPTLSYVSLTSSSVSVVAGTMAPVTVTAEVHSDFGTTLSGVVVNFSVPGKNPLSATSVITDANGRATVTYQTTATPETVEVTAVAGSASATTSFNVWVPTTSIKSVTVSDTKVGALHTSTTIKFTTTKDQDTWVWWEDAPGSYPPTLPAMDPAATKVLLDGAEVTGVFYDFATLTLGTLTAGPHTLLIQDMAGPTEAMKVFFHVGDSDPAFAVTYPTPPPTPPVSSAPPIPAPPPHPPLPAPVVIPTPAPTANQVDLSLTNTTGAAMTDVTAKVSVADPAQAKNVLVVTADQSSELVPDQAITLNGVEPGKSITENLHLKFLKEGVYTVNVRLAWQGPNGPESHNEAITVGALSRTSPYFADLETVPWASAQIELLHLRDIARGDGFRRFDPSRPITRLEFVALVTRTLTGFNDDVLTWHDAAMKQAEALGLLKPLADKDMHAAITRTEAAEVLRSEAQTNAVGNPLERETVKEVLAAYQSPGANDDKEFLTRADAALLILHVSIHPVLVYVD